MLTGHFVDDNYLRILRLHVFRAAVSGPNAKHGDYGDDWNRRPRA